MALRKAAGSVHIAMPPAEVWEKLRDLTLADQYVRDVTGCHIDTEQREGVGTSRTVTLANGDTMQETVEEWDEGHGFLLRLHKGDKPAMPIFSRFYFRYAIKDDGEGTRFHPALLYQTRFGPIGWLIGKLAHKRMEQSAQDVGERMKRFYETGFPQNAEVEQ